MTCRLVAFDFARTLADSFACFVASLSEAARRHAPRHSGNACVSFTVSIGTSVLTLCTPGIRVR